VDDRRATLTAGSAVFTMAAMPVSEFPPMPDLPPVVGTIDGDAFAAAVGQIIGAASTENALPVLRGVHITSEGDELVLRATDKYRLAEVTLSWSSAGGDVDLLVNAAWLTDVAKTLAGEASLLADGNLVGIRTGNRATTSIIIDGDYPKIKALFPESTDIQLTVSRAALTDVLSRVALVAERNTPVKLTTAKGFLTVEAGTGEDATGRETMPCEAIGDDITAAFNPTYLAWSLSATPSEDVDFGFQADLRKPALITGAPGLRHLLMPVRL
jgi:DNA polymerase-3 subunit beta